MTPEQWKRLWFDTEALVEEYMASSSQMRPEGVFLWICESSVEQRRQIIKRVEKW